MEASQQGSDLHRSSTNLSQTSTTSQTAQDYIASQLSLEADAREALPYQFDTCTYPLGPLKQSVYACLTCTPPPASPAQQFTPAGVCYSCSISCHGEHNLVELFTKRDFVCDCGTTRLSNSGTPCSLRHNATTGRKGDVRGEKAKDGNRYNRNFEGKFCGCGDEYDPEKEKGTMFQCLGLGNVETGGCGEDWWHPECLLGLPRIKHEEKPNVEANGSLQTVKEEAENEEAQPGVNGASNEERQDHDEPPLPPGFPDEDSFEHLICYKCARAFPWIIKYARSPGFAIASRAPESNETHAESSTAFEANSTATLKRKAEDGLEDEQETKKARSEPSTDDAPVERRPQGEDDSQPKHSKLPPAPEMAYPTLFLEEDFRDHLCRCPECFPLLAKHRQLLEEEDNYEPPLSESDNNENNDTHSVGGRSVNSGSLLDRGEAALSSMDRVRAIEGVMAYNHVRDKVKQFLQPFAESGTPVGAEDIKAYFAKLRGDEAAIREAAVGAEGSGVQGDGRREQGGY